ncbi:MAG: RNA polymerase sigma factor [Victivallaceae bacterium]
MVKEKHNTRETEVIKPDIELIKGYLGGAGNDFEELYDRYKKMLYGYLNNMLPQQQSAVDDIFQQTWLKVIEKLPEYRCSNRFSAWLFRIAHNLAIDHFRRSKKFNNQLELDSEDAPELPDKDKLVWENMDRSDFERAMGQALETLQEEQREVFMLRLDKISFKEIAGIQNCSINTVLARMQYAMKNLKKSLIAWKT